MKKIIVVFSITAALIAAALIIPSVFAAKEKNAVPAVPPAAVTPTATPVAQPTVAPTQSALMPPAMTAGEFYKRLHEREINLGASVVITDAVAGKEKGNIIFEAPWDDFTRGKMSFGIYIQLSEEDFSKIGIGETITVKAEVLTYSSGRYAILSDGVLLR